MFRMITRSRAQGEDCGESHSKIPARESVPADQEALIVRGGQKCLVSHVWEVIGRRSDKSQGTQEGGAGAQALHGRSIARAFVRTFGSKKLAGKLRPFSTCLNAVLAASRRDQGLYGFPITCRCAQGVPANII
jgi:hypothetical protein